MGICGRSFPDISSPGHVCMLKSTWLQVGSRKFNAIVRPKPQCCKACAPGEDIMAADNPHSHPLTRRALVAGAAAGTLALGAEPASAQRCPAVPPARTKGPLVWLEMDQHELDESYDQSVYAFNQQHIADRRNERNVVALKVLGKPDRVAYGAAEIEKVDIYKSKRADAPVMVYLHGGGWRSGRSCWC